MSDGVTASISELIALRQQSQFSLSHCAHSSRLNGQYRSPLRGRGMEFSEVRNYQAGDEIRHMEWRVTARTGRAHVKLFHEERERPVFFVVDFNPSMFFGTRVAFKSVIAARLCALLAWRAFYQGDKIGGLCFSALTHHEFFPNAREAYLMKLLGRLAEYTQANTSLLSMGARPLSDALLRIRRVNKPGSLIILISDFYAFDSESDQHLTQLRQHNDILAFHLCDPIELAPPKAGLYPITDGKQHFLLNTHDFNTQETYQKIWSERHAQLKTRCQRLGLLYTQVQTTTPLIQLLHQVMPGRHHAS
jgi:uncharacterized protein (DUF58 family)